MIITEKMIRELQRRVDISYEDAEKSLRRAGGNIEIAEEHALKKANSFGTRLFREFEKIINATLIYRIKVDKKDDVFLNVPIIGVLLMMLVIGVNKTLLLGVVFIILALLAECNLQIHKVSDQDEFRFYKTVNKEELHSKNKDISEVDDQTEVTEQEVAQSEQVTGVKADINSPNKESQSNNEEDDYYEVTIDK